MFAVGQVGPGRTRLRKAKIVLRRVEASDTAGNHRTPESLRTQGKRSWFQSSDVRQLMQINQML